MRGAVRIFMAAIVNEAEEDGDELLEAFEAVEAARMLTGAGKQCSVYTSCTVTQTAGVLGSVVTLSGQSQHGRARSGSTG